MALIVEDGTGLSTADALISLAYFKTYADARGWDYSAYSDTLIENAIRRGSEYISNAFVFAGVKFLQAQALSWPRYGIVDLDGYSVASDEVPVAVQRASAEATWRELVTVGSLTPDVTLTDRVKAEAVGALSVTYADIGRSANNARPDVKIIRDLLRGLLSGSAGVVTLVRA